MSEDPQNILPTKKTKLWKNNVKKDESWKPLTPNFCPYVDPETDKKCGKFMHRIVTGKLFSLCLRRIMSTINRGL